MSTCETCDNQTRDDAYACDACVDAAARRLGEMPWLAEQLELTISNQRAAIEGNGSASAETPLAYNLAAAEKRDALRNALVTAVRFCAEEGIRNQSPVDGLPDDTLVAMSRWLLWRVDGLALNDMGPQILHDLARTAKACRRVIDKPPERSYAGPCPECKRDLYHRPDAAQASCSGCGSRWDVGEINAWMRVQITTHLADRLVTAQEGATLLGRFGMPVEIRTVDKWRERGRLVEHGRAPGIGDRPGARLYRWDDLLRLAAANVARGA